MSELLTTILAEVTVLSPLHIGSGTTLQRDFDWVERNGWVYFFNQDALFETVLARAESSGRAGIVEITSVLMEMTIPDLEQAGWLASKDFRDKQSRLFRYVLRTIPRLGEIHEQIKDVYDRPFVPGSSLKGALRTLLAWGIYTTTNRLPDLRRLKPGRSWAAQPLERDIFGRDPNHDWLRALRITDGPPLDINAMRLEGVRVYPTARRGRGPGLDLNVEAIRPGTVFTTTVTIDEYGFQEEVARKLRWDGQRKWLAQLAELGRAHSRQRLQAEENYFHRRREVVGAINFYEDLQRRWSTLDEKEFLIQVGWGAGWGSKTLDQLLKRDERAFAQLLSSYRMIRRGARRAPGDSFPISRKLAIRREGPSLPMGWVKVRLRL